MQKITSNQPYLLRAFYEWIVDNQLTPYVLVSTEYPYVNVPLDFVKDGQIVLNVSPSACQGFVINNEYVEFNARFGGKPTFISFPCASVKAIYAKENGMGTAFDEPVPIEPSPQEQPTGVSTSDEQSAEQTEKPKSDTKKASKPSLRVVK